MPTATGVRYEENVCTEATNVPYGAEAPVYTMPGARVTVLAYPDNGTSAAIFADQELTQPVDNPMTTDNAGRFGFWIAPGTYQYAVETLSGNPGGSYIFSVGNGSASGGGGDQDGPFLQLHPTATQVVTQPETTYLIFAGSGDGSTNMLVVAMPATHDGSVGINGPLVVNGTTQINAALNVNASTYQTDTVSVASSIATNGDRRFGFATNGDINTASALNGGGGLGAGQRTVTTDADLAGTDYAVWADATDANLTLTLPDAASFNAVLVPGNFHDGLTATTTAKVGRMYVAKKIDASANTVTLAAQAGQLIDGAPNLTLATQYDFVSVQTDGANWGVVGR